MDLDPTKQFLLVKAVEEADRDGEVIPIDDRVLADDDGDLTGQLLERSSGIYATLSRKHPLQTSTAMALTSSSAWANVAIVVVAFLFGLATKQLGPERRINVLAFPLLGILAWNLLVYAAALVGTIFRKWPSPVSRALAGLVRSITDRGLRRLDGGGDNVLATGLSRYVSRWYELTADAKVGRLRAALHLAAAALAIGVIAGMYLNGFAYQYLAAWESTFLSADGVRSMFSTLFAPASAISGIAVAEIAEIRAMELKAGEEGMPAADWIHLFAITVGLFVFLPRLGMAWWEARRAARVGRIDFRAGSLSYIEKLMKTREGGNLVARLFPHRMELGSKDRDHLRALAHQMWGGQLWVEFEDPIGYGEEEAQFEGADYQVLVLNFSATPEDESQGRLVRRFRAQLGGAGLVLLSVAPFRERFGGLAEFDRRLGERRDAWEAVLGRAGVGFALDDGDADETRSTAAKVMLDSSPDA